MLLIAPAVEVVHADEFIETPAKGTVVNQDGIVVLRFEPVALQWAQVDEWLLRRPGRAGIRIIVKSLLQRSFQHIAVDSIVVRHPVFRHQLPLVELPGEIDVIVVERGLH